MRWICEIERSADGLQAGVVDGDRTEFVGLQDQEALGIRKFSSWRGTRPGRIVVSPEDLRRTRLPMVNARGWPPARAIRSQSFFSVRSHGQDFVLPAQELIRALFGRTRWCWVEIFSPRGPRQLATHEAADSRAVFDWVSRYPTARAAWGSVYLAALSGRLDLVLPRARLGLGFRYFPSSGSSVAMAMTLDDMRPLEPPINGPLLPIPLVQKQNRAMKIVGLLRPDGTWACSDAEWAEVQLVLSVWPHPGLRREVDLLLEKFGRGVPWSAIQMSYTDRKSASLHPDGQVAKKIFEIVRAARAT